MRLIDADELSVRIMTSSSLTDDFFGAGLQRGLDIAIEEIQEMPTIDAEPVKHGRWIEDGEFQICSECGEEHGWIEFRATYCDNCGAKMDEVSECDKEDEENDDGQI